MSRAVAGVTAGRGRGAQCLAVQAVQLGVAAVAIDIAELLVGITMARAHVARIGHRAGKRQG